MARRPPQTTIDYLVVALNPVLIMFLIGSLAFFLIEVSYHGEFQGRLRWVCALFVMAAVLVCRISIEEGIEYAGLFAIPLAAVTLMSMVRFVDAYFLVDILLIAVVWWSAYKLTWDCTVVDDRQTASGSGLLETVGLDPVAENEKPETSAPDVPFEDEDEPSATTGGPDEPEEGFLKRLFRRSRKHHSPGVWVVYFAMASLPLFGIGQILLNEQGRSEGFRLLVIYVASALGLLMTTSLLQLRRYLRQRHLAMPDAMAGSWLGMGSVMAIAVLILCMLLPLPSPDYSVTGIIRKILSPDNLNASRWSTGREGVKTDQQQGPGESRKDDSSVQSSESGRDDPRDSDQSGDSRPSETQSNSNQSSESDQPNESSSSQKSSQDTSQQSESGNRQSSGSSKNDSSERNDPEHNSSKNDSSERNDPEHNDPENNNSEDRQSTRDSQSTDSERTDSGSAEESDSPSEADSATDSRGNTSADDNASDGKQDVANTPPQSPFSQWSSFGPLLRVLYWIVFLGVVGYLAWRYRHELYVGWLKLMQQLRDLLARLFGRDKEAFAEDAEDEVATGPSGPPFAAYQNPFASGAAGGWPLSELVRYSFDALEAWAREHGCGRRPEQTPIEFAEQLGRAAKPLAQSAQTLAGLYNHVAYDKNQPHSESNVEAVRQLWDVLS